MAIYALKKLAVVQNNNRKTRIQFILRDQIESDNSAMNTAYNTLKKSLKDAASAAGANLEELIQVPTNPDEIIAMFPSALD